MTDRNIVSRDAWNAMAPQAMALGLTRLEFEFEGRVRRVTIRGTRDSFHGRSAENEARVDALRRAIESRTLPMPQTIETFGEQTYGVEFEVIMPRGMTHVELARRLFEAGVPTNAEGYNHSVRSHWKVITDGSLGNYRSGAEVVSPILSGMEGIEMIRKVCRVLGETRCRANRRCGFHVHVGARGRPFAFFKNAMMMYAKFQDVLDTVVAPSRRASANVYCNPVRLDPSWETATELNQLSRSNQGDRYRKLSVASYWRHGTIEFRHHQGTVEAEKAENWVRMCLRLAASAARVTAEAIGAALPSLEGFAALVGLKATELAYFLNRARYFETRIARAQASRNPNAVRNVR